MIPGTTIVQSVVQRRCNDFGVYVAQTGLLSRTGVFVAVARPVHVFPAYGLFMRFGRERKFVCGGARAAVGATTVRG